MNLKNVHENTVSENSSSERNQVDSFNEQQIQNKEKFKCYVCHEKFGQYQLEVHFATIQSEILNETEKPDENIVEIL